MAKWSGQIGYGVDVEVTPGRHEIQINERRYYGDLTRNTRRYVTGEGLNDNLEIQNDISIVADEYAYQNFHSIMYVTYMGNKWKVRSVEVKHPRLILSIGGLYND